MPHRIRPLTEADLSAAAERLGLSAEELQGYPVHFAMGVRSMIEAEEEARERLRQQAIAERPSLGAFSEPVITKPAEMVFAVIEAAGKVRELAELCQQHRLLMVVTVTEDPGDGPEGEAVQVQSVHAWAGLSSVFMLEAMIANAYSAIAPQIVAEAVDAQSEPEGGSDAPAA